MATVALRERASAEECCQLQLHPKHQQGTVSTTAADQDTSRSYAARGFYQLQGSIMPVAQPGAMLVEAMQTYSTSTASCLVLAPIVHQSQHRVQYCAPDLQQAAQSAQAAAILAPGTSSSRARSRHRWLKRLVLLGTSAVVTTVAGILIHRLQRLERTYHQVTHTQQQLHSTTAALHSHTQQLGSSMASLQQQVDTLEAADAALAADVAELAAQQGELQQGQQQLLDQVALVTARQAALDGLADRLQQELGATLTALDQKEQQQQHSAAASNASSTQVTSSGSSSKSSAAAGDLTIQLTIPGFTEVLVDRVTDSQLVPAAASALVQHVKDSNLIPHAAGVVVATAGQRMTGALNPVNWPWPWRLRRGAAEAQDTLQ